MKREQREKRTCALDLAEVSGYAMYDGNKLSYCGEVAKKPRGKGRWQEVRWYPGQVDPELIEHRDERTAWENIFFDAMEPDIDFFVVESIHAHFANSTISLAKRHGRVAVYARQETYKKWIEVEPAKWRAPLKKYLGEGTWGKGRDEKKRNAQHIAATVWKVDAGPDVADAVCIGHWFTGAP